MNVRPLLSTRTKYLNLSQQQSLTKIQDIAESKLFFEAGSVLRKRLTMLQLSHSRQFAGCYELLFNS